MLQILVFYLNLLNFQFILTFKNLITFCKRTKADCHSAANWFLSWLLRVEGKAQEQRQQLKLQLGVKPKWSFIWGKYVQKKNTKIILRLC